MLSITKIVPHDVKDHFGIQYSEATIHDSTSGKNHSVKVLINDGFDEVHVSVVVYSAFVIALQTNGAFDKTKFDLIKKCRAALESLDTQGQFFKVAKACYYKDGFFYREDQRGWLCKASSVWLANNPPKIEVRTDREAGVVHCNVVTRSGYIIVSCSRVTVDEFTINQLIGDMLYELLIKGWISPNDIKDYYAEIARNPRVYERGFTNVINISGQRYNVQHIEQAYFDFFDGLLPEETEMAKQTMVLDPDGDHFVKSGYANVFSLANNYNVYKRRNDVIFRRPEGEHIVYTNVLTQLDYLLCLVDISRYISMTDRRLLMTLPVLNDFTPNDVGDHPVTLEELSFTYSVPEHTSALPVIRDIKFTGTDEAVALKYSSYSFLNWLICKRK